MRKLLLGSLLFLIPCVLIAQSQESAYEGRGSLKAGAELSSYNPDFYCPSSSPFSCGRSGLSLMKGIGVFADYNIGSRWGAEGEARWLRWDGYAGQLEATYLAGPRYRFYRWRALGFWAKFLIGDGAITTANYPLPSSLEGNFLVYAPGASVDYRLSRRFSLRGDYELQKWPSFAVAPTSGSSGGSVVHNHGLTPNGLSIGVSYTITGR